MSATLPPTLQASPSQAPTLQAHTLANLAGIRHGFFTRAGGVSGGVYASLNAGVGSDDEPKNVAENRARMAAAMGVAPERFLTCYQIHSPEVVVAVEPWKAEGRPRADAIVTTVPGLAIGVSTADCGPVLFADSEARVIGAAHAGWRGALAGVTDSALAAMERLGASRARIVAALGPMIRQPNYEVGAELRDRFAAADPGNTRFFRPSTREQHFMFDLAGYVVARLAAAGVGTIENVEACTYEDEAKFFSYRRMTHRAEPDYGRHVNAIVLSPAR
jgi:polyphenol oxidase